MYRLYSKSIKDRDVFLDPVLSLEKSYSVVKSDDEQAVKTEVCVHAYLSVCLSVCCLQNPVILGKDH